MDIIEYIQNSSGFSASTIEIVLNSLSDGVAAAIRQGKEIKVKSLGVFGHIDVAERPGVNPKNGEPLVVGAYRRPKLTFAANFKKFIQPDPAVENAAVENAVDSTLPPPIPAELIEESQKLAETVPVPETIWVIKAPDGNGTVNLPTSELLDWGVNKTTPVFSEATGWKLAGKVAELAHLFS